MRLILIFLLLGALFTGLPTPGGAQTTEGAAETPALMLERWDAESGRIEQRLAEDPPHDHDREGRIGAAAPAIAGSR
jgi:hypothetical protein